jgi:tetratricopeptide (TPR) repeat protein
LALNPPNYEEALKQYDIGLAADPEQAALLTNKAAALKGLGVKKYNESIQSKDEAGKTAGIDAAKADFKNAAETADRAIELIKKEPAVTDPTDQKRHDANKYAALSVRSEAYRLYVSKADGTKADAGIVAFQEYIAVEPDAAKKSKAQLDLAQMLLDAGAGDKAFAEYQKILAASPDDPDANLGAGLALYSTGDKAKYQEAANYFQHFVDKAPDTHKFKADAKAMLAELKNTENVVPEKTAPARRKRP